MKQLTSIGSPFKTLQTRLSMTELMCVVSVPMSVIPFECNMESSVRYN